MTTGLKKPQGTSAWFEMVGTLLCEAATQASLPPGLTVSLLERYTDGTELAPGLVQGIRFDIIDGQPSFRVGAHEVESADVTIELTAAAARQLNALYSADPAYQATRDQFLRTGAMRVAGDPARLGSWLSAAHDPIVARTS